MTPLRIYVVDDHEILRQGLVALINAEADMTVSGEAADSQVALARLLACDVDIVVMGLSIPGLDGVQAIRALKAACPDIKIVALSVHDDAGALRRLLDVGVSGYVLKRSAAEELVHALRVVTDGQIYICPVMAAKIVAGFVRRLPLRGEIAGSELSGRENEVIQRIARGFSNKEIAAEFNLSVKTVETYKARAMEKLDIGSRADLVRYAVEQGWLAVY